MDAFYSTPAWRQIRARVIARDGGRCSVARLLGGACTGPLHVHHIEPRRLRADLALVEDNCGTCCAAHHPKWEAVRLFVERSRRELPPCRHRHPYRIGQEACDRERAKKLGIVLERAA